MVVRFVVEFVVEFVADYFFVMIYPQQDIKPSNQSINQPNIAVGWIQSQNPSPYFFFKSCLQLQ